MTRHCPIRAAAACREAGVLTRAVGGGGLQVSPPVHHDHRSGVRDGLALPGRPRGHVKQSPFWVEEHPRPENITSDLPGEADVLIVGSGLTGLTAALRCPAAGNR